MKKIRSVVFRTFMSWTCCIVLKLNYIYVNFETYNGKSENLVLKDFNRIDVSAYVGLTKPRCVITRRISFTIMSVINTKS